MSEIDVTLSVLIDNVTANYQNVTEQVIRDMGVSVSDVEFALEKELMRLKNEKMRLYATAMYNDFQKRKDGNKNGD